MYPSIETPAGVVTFTKSTGRVITDASRARNAELSSSTRTTLWEGSWTSSVLGGSSKREKV